MSKFFITFDGASDSEQVIISEDVTEARNSAIRLLGGYLQAHPDFADQGNWRVELRDHARRLIAHVVVATVAAAPHINWESFERQPDNYKLGSRPG